MTSYFHLVLRHAQPSLISTFDLLSFTMSNTDKHEFNSICKWKSYSNDVINVTFTYKKMHSCSKNIYFTWNEKQVLTTYTNLSRFCSLGTTPVPSSNEWANENPKVDTRSRESNSGPYGFEVDTLPHDQGHHIINFSALMLPSEL